jgi:hypothetical protein
VWAAAAAVLIPWLKAQWACITQPKCAVTGWAHGVLILVAVLGVAAAITFGVAWYRAHRQLNAKPRPYKPLDVHDKKLNLRWVIRQPPSAWLHWRNIANTISPIAVQAVLDGPFHAREAGRDATRHFKNHGCRA